MFARLGIRGYRLARRLVIALIGGTVMLGGIIMLLTPGPGLAAIALGLAILALEFAWAKIWLDRLKARLNREQLGSLLEKAHGLGRGWLLPRSRPRR